MSIVIAGYYGFGNAGDELILLSLITRYRREDPDISMTVLSADPASTRREFAVESVNRWRPLTWIRPLLTADRFILGGGGLLQESTGRRNHLYYLALVIAAKLLGCETDLVAQGVDPVHGLFNRFWTRWVLNHWADRISVRDTDSLQALLEAGVEPPIPVEKDPVADLPIVRTSKPLRRIAFALSPVALRGRFATDTAAFCDRVAKQLEMDADLLVFFKSQDESYARDIASVSARIHDVRIWENAREVLSWLPQYQGVVATRFHALLLAAASGIPFAGWGDQHKVETFCKDHGMPYANAGSGAIENQFLGQILALYQSPNKSVILASRID